MKEAAMTVARKDEDLSGISLFSVDLRRDLVGVPVSSETKCIQRVTLTINGNIGESSNLLVLFNDKMIFVTCFAFLYDKHVLV